MRKVVYGVVLLGGALMGCAGMKGGALGQYAAVTPAERSAVQSACEAKARSTHLEVVNFHGIREVEPSKFEADMTVEFKGSRYERACRYNARNQAVDIADSPGDTGLAPLGAQVTERERARDACEAKAKADAIEILRWGVFREASPDHWEADIHVRWKGKEYDRVCRYRDRGQSVDIDDH